MYAKSAMRQYQQVDTHAQVLEASPHRLIQMLMEGGLSRLAQAKGAMSRGQIAEKGVLVGKAIDIIGGLREGLDMEKGGEIAANLNNLYLYMTRCLIEANKTNDESKLDEVAKLLRTIKEGWDGIAPAA
ncbi:flagellar export chaperone FliS [Pseudomonas luteola]|uniref:flagellar export chaperone FliS n=1 Tax=Pseudomonas TaxID=286 RepID=UPI00123C333A|nr:MULTISPECIES: flagellar export chaperone FliS [Pseudomonas]MBA1247947.1 flagellar export chaperone FliS [Pseudomonas zeshuii]QEU29463.1 flagellar export chaperone FliS [Pseudomonas luteola]